MYDGTGKHNYLDNAEGTNKDVRRAHIAPVYEGNSAPVVDIQSGATIGFRYLNFGTEGASKATINGDFPKGFKVSIRLDSYDGNVVAEKAAEEDVKEIVFELSEKVTGKHAVYFEFVTENDETRSVLDTFTFD